MCVNLHLSVGICGVWRRVIRKQQGNRAIECDEFLRSSLKPRRPSQYAIMTLPTAADRRSLCSMMNTPVRTERRKAVGRFATVKVTDSFEHALIQTDACRQWMDGIDCYCYFFSVILHLVFHWIYLLESKDVRTWENCHCNVKRLCSTMYSGTIFLDSQKRVVRDTVPEI